MKRLSQALVAAAFFAALSANARVATAYYDCEQGHFISRDPIKRGVNWYEYANNNPLVSLGRMMRLGGRPQR